MISGSKKEKKMLRSAKSRSFCGLCIAAAIWASGSMLGSTAQGATLSKNNSDLTINTSGPSPFITSWTVDGVDQYGGSPAGSEDFQISTGGGSLVELNSLALTSPPDPSLLGIGLFSATYSGAGFTVNVQETLGGGNIGSGSSSLSEVITINNTEALPTDATSNVVELSPLTFRLVQLSNLTLDAIAGNDTLTLSPSQPNTANQTNPLGTVANISVTATPTSFTGGTVGSQSASTGPFVGNDAFSFEWDGTIDPGGSYQVSINETVQGATSAAVPLPSAAKSALAMLGGLAVIGIVRRMRKAKA
jgi:hypothetical protein